MKNAFLFLFVACLSFSGLFVGACTLDAPSDPVPSGGSTAEGGTGTAGSLGKAGTMSGTGGATSSSAGTSSRGGGASGEAGSGTAGAAGAESAPDCSALEKSCDGACVEIDDPAYGCDPTLCTTDGCPQAANAQLACEAGQCVLGSCKTGTKKCGEKCVAIDDAAYGCGAASCDASTCPSQGTGGTVVCEGSACVIGSCPTGYKKCGNKCVAVSDPTYGCGAATCDATACPAAGTGTLICQASACVVGTCGAGTKKCGDKCVTIDANNGCADAARCTPCANNEACTGSPTTCQCVPTPMATACSGKCGSVSNGCGGTYTCNGCTSPQTCGGGGTANICGCTPTPMATACNGKNCGTVSNGCGGTYTCGSCTSPQTCAGAGVANVCGCTKTAMTTACNGKNCGTVADGCGGTYPCGSCTSPQTCAGAGVANVCGCTKIAMATACSQKSCGTAADGCNGTYTCGTCSSPSAPICLSNACKQCGSVADCPSGSFNCVNNACVCRTPSTANVINDGGFDNQSDLSKWTSSGTVWTNSDADGCPGSGSVTISSSGSIKRCFQIPQVPASGAEYAFGFRYKTGPGGSGCFGGTFQDANCTQNGSLFINIGTSESSIWSSEFFQGSVPEGTSSISVECKNSSSLTLDQMFLRKTGFTGPGF
jgi:hypothetical protein